MGHKEPKFNTITGSCWKKSLVEARERRRKNKSKITDKIKMKINKPVPQDDDDNVICPHCLHEYQPEGEDYSEFDRIEKCDNCGKEYILCQSFTVTNHTRPVE